jgi:single-strand DNA-binding protein
MLNTTFMEGRLTADPVLQQSKNGNHTRYCRFRIANVRFKNKNEVTGFFNCIAFEATAEAISKWLHKGDSVTVVGTLVNDQYEKDGEKRTVTKIEVKEISFGNRKRNAEPSENSILETLDPAEFEEIFADEDVPF